MDPLVSVRSRPDPRLAACLLVLIACTVCRGQVITTVAGGGGNGLGDGGLATGAELTQPSGVAVDQAGNIYIADHQAQRVRKVNTAKNIATYAGTGTAGFSGDTGPASTAALRDPYGVAVDGDGNLYIADRLNYRIRKVTPGGVITTYAGNGTSGFSGDNGPATAASFTNPSGVALDGAGNLYIADTNNNRIRKVNALGIITTVAGNGNGSFSGDSGPAISAGIPAPNSVAVDSGGNLYICDSSNRVRKVTMPGGTISTVAGTGTPAFAGDGGAAISAQISQPSGVAVDAAGNVYISDMGNARIRKVTGGTISTFAGGGAAMGDGGPATSARFNLPLGLTLDSAGNLYIADANGGRIRKVSVAATTTAVSVSPNSLSFSYTTGGSNPAAQSVTVSSSTGALTVAAAVSSGGNWLSVTPASGSTPLNLVASVTPGSLTAGSYTGAITVTPPSGAGNPITITVNLLVASGAGSISTVAGNGIDGFSGDGGRATAAWVRAPIGVTVDAAGNLYIAQPSDFRIRKVTAGGIISTVAGNGTLGFSGDGGPATSAALMPPLNGHQGLATDTAGNLYFADFGNGRVRKVDPQGIISTVAGNGNLQYSGDGSAATSAGIPRPVAVAVDAAGNLYIASLLNARVRKVTPNGIISTVAGSGALGFSGDGGPATSAAFNAPYAVAVDGAGNLYIADQTAARVRKVNSDGIISTVAGNGAHGSSGDGGPATSASLDPTGLAVDSAGNIYISDQNNRIRKVTPGGLISTIAGTGVALFSGDGGPAVNAAVSSPGDVALDSSGNLYIADSNNNRVRRIAGAAPSSTGGTPAVTLVANAFGEAPLIAPNTWVEIKGTNLAPAGHIRIWGDADFTGNRMPTQLDGVGVTVNGKSAFVYYISPTQINILTPPDALPSSVEVKVTSGSSTNSANVQAAANSAAFFVFDATHATAIHADGSIIGPASLYPGVSTPARPNETIILYANGLGATSDPIVSGSPAQSGSLPALPVIRIGGIAATVQFAGLVSPGLYQLNVVVPDSVPNGDNALTGTYSGLPMQSGVTLAVQR